MRWPVVAGIALLSACFSAREGGDDGGTVRVDGGTPERDGGPTVRVDGGTPERDAGSMLPADCTPETDPDVQEVCSRLLGPGSETPGPTAPRIVSFEWAYLEPCSDGEPTWFDLDLELSDPDHDPDELVVCGILMGGGTGFFDAREPTCQVAQTGGDSLNLAVGDPDGNSSRVGTVVYGCSAGTGP